MRKYEIEVTEDEAELLGYALTKAYRSLLRRRDKNPASYRAEELAWNAQVIECVRNKLDMAIEIDEAAETDWSNV